jgi:hypothetical protein
MNSQSTISLGETSGGGQWPAVPKLSPESLFSTSLMSIWENHNFEFAEIILLISFNFFRIFTLRDGRRHRFRYRFLRSEICASHPPSGNYLGLCHMQHKNLSNSVYHNSSTTFTQRSIPKPLTYFNALHIAMMFTCSRQKSHESLTLSEAYKLWLGFRKAIRMHNSIKFKTMCCRQ